MNIDHISGHTRVAAVIGWPVEHSLSPIIHNAWFSHVARAWVYVAFPVEPKDLTNAISGMRALHLGGLSVTMPHKEDVIAHLDAIDDIASALRAVNCVGIQGDQLVGTNTDGDGCCNAIEEQADVVFQDSRVAVLGAGGTARAITAAAMRRGAQVVVVNRSAARAHELSDIMKSLPAPFHVGSVTIGTMDDVASCDVVINATSVGMGTNDMPCDVGVLSDNAVVLDAVYSPLQTAWLRACASKGCTTIDGLWMLIHQAMLQQQWWFSESPDSAVMRAAAERELERRRQ